jgi:hypothetical protein
MSAGKHDCRNWSVRIVADDHRDAMTADRSISKAEPSKYTIVAVSRQHD